MSDQERSELIRLAARTWGPNVDNLDSHDAYRRNRDHAAWLEEFAADRRFEAWQRRMS